MRFCLNFKSLVLLLMLALLAMVPAYAGNINVEYNQQQDKITIHAANASLTQLLAQIANKTDMTIQIDPAVEKQVSFQLRPQPLQQALQKVVKGMSYVIEYSIDEKQQTVVSGLRLLPKGKQDSGQLVSVSVLNTRASQINGEGGDVSGGSLNRRGNYYPGSRQPRANYVPRPSINNNQGSMGEDEMMNQDNGAVSEYQNHRKLDKKNQKLGNTKIGPLLDPASME